MVYMTNMTKNCVEVNQWTERDLASSVGNWKTKDWLHVIINFGINKIA